MLDAAGAETSSYDAAGNLVRHARSIDDVIYVTESGYDAGGRLLWTRYPDGDAVGTPETPRRYNMAGQLDAIPGLIDQTEYDANGNLIAGAGRLSTVGRLRWPRRYARGVQGR